MVPLRPHLLLFVALVVSLAQAASAFVLNGRYWPAGSEIVMHLQLQGLPPDFRDGVASWNDSAADALAAWNQELGTVQFVRGSSPGTSGGDGKNSAFFSSTVYGDSFGDNVLAVAVNFSGSGSSVFTEVDVIFNTRRQWATYRGDGPYEAPYIYDLHRVALHEFGHVLGLGHPDQQGQPGTDALMNSLISDRDYLSADDAAGARHLYGSPVVQAPLGSPMTYQVLSRTGGTFSAANLPPGLVIDAQTGVISGVAEISGTYQVRVTISGPSGPYVFTIQIVVTAPPTAPGPNRLLSTIPLWAAQLAADPQRPRVYATLPLAASVAVIDTNSLSVIKTIPVTPRPQGLAVSADGKKLWVVGLQSPGNVDVIDLETLQLVQSFPLPHGGSDVKEGMQGRLYVSSSAVSELVQIDSATGALGASVQTSAGSSGLLQVTPDRRTLLNGRFGGNTLAKFDISGAVPVEVSSKVASALGQDLAISTDGSYILFPGNGLYYGHPGNSTPKIRTADPNTAAGAFHLPSAPGCAVFSGDDKFLYHSAITEGSLYVFDAETLVLLETITTRVPDQNSSPDLMSDITLDKSGGLLFYATLGAYSPPQIRIYGTGRLNASGSSTPRSKSLLNVSTRLRAQLNDGVLIAGFIITGNEPKKVALRALGPSLPLADRLADPRLDLRGAGGELVAANDNWNARRAEVLGSGLAPADERESAIIATLPPGAYTAILQGVASTIGVGLVELYDLQPGSTSRIANIATRGKVETGDNVMIGGFIIGGDQPTKVIVRAIGPSLATHGVAGALLNPTLDLHDGNGTRFASNDDWRSDQAAEIIASTVPPADDQESAIVRTLQPGGYTAIVRGKNDTSGIALVEVFNLEPQ
ncbi:MAG: matrixin family metalloprotease [Chthoniobacterales bacterium]|nr:matrixin family metalloprotease [Chthoniobacterales bacterium]